MYYNIGKNENKQLGLFATEYPVHVYTYTQSSPVILLLKLTIKLQVLFFFFPSSKIHTFGVRIFAGVFFAGETLFLGVMVDFPGVFAGDLDLPSGSSKRKDLSMMVKISRCFSLAAFFNGLLLTNTL